jgi:hypothetical protein
MDGPGEGLAFLEKGRGRCRRRLESDRRICVQKFESFERKGCRRQEKRKTNSRAEAEDTTAGAFGKDGERRGR